MRAKATLLVTLLFAVVMLAGCPPKGGGGGGTTTTPTPAPALPPVPRATSKVDGGKWFVGVNPCTCTSSASLWSCGVNAACAAPSGCRMFYANPGDTDWTDLGPHGTGTPGSVGGAYSPKGPAAGSGTSFICLCVRPVESGD